MRGSIWTLLAAAVGSALFLYGAVPAAMPSSPASSTSAAGSVLQATGPYAGLFIMLAAVGTLLGLAFKI